MRRERKIKNWRYKGLTLLLCLFISVALYNVNISPVIAGGAGDYSVSNYNETTRWGLNAIKAREAWKVTKGSDEIVVAVIDSGIDRSIPALRKNMWINEDEIPNDGLDNDHNGYVDDVSGWDFRNEEDLSKNYSSLNYHGTFVAGLVGSVYDRNSGAGGVSPNVSLMDLRFLNSKGKFYSSDWQKLADAIDYAVENGASIINMSLFSSVSPPSLVRRAVQRAESKGVLVVGIAGNDGSRVRHFGRWHEIFTVGSINRNKDVSHFSNYGPEVEVVAPGQNVLSFSLGGGTVTGSGTSFAAPHIAGSAALILSQAPDLTLAELKAKLRESTHDIGKSGKDYKSGYGIIDVRVALGLAESTDRNKDGLKTSGYNDEVSTNFISYSLPIETRQDTECTRYEGYKFWYSTEY